MSFYAPFLVQVKSEPEKEVIYGSPDKKRRWKKEEIEWLFSQELPLLIGCNSFGMRGRKIIDLTLVLPFPSSLMF
jgi:hypothetical protein